MKGKKLNLPLYCLFLACCMALNWGGDQLVSRLNWPVWLDSVGTVLCAYIAGPYCGAVLGASSNLLAYILYGVSPAYALISILIGLVAGFAARKKMLETLLGTLTTGAILAGCTTVAAYPINMILSGGSTGNNWGDAVIGFLEERGFPRWITLLVGELYVELLDKLVILLALFVITRIFRAVTRKRKKSGEDGGNEGGETGKAAARAAALLLACALTLQGIPALSRAETVNTAAATESGFNDYVQTIYSSLNGLPCGEANDIAQTTDGIMWIGTYAGLYRYNGREFRWMDGFDSSGSGRMTTACPS